MISAMLRKFFMSWIKEPFAYGKEILNDALASSEKIGGIWKKLAAFALFIIPAAAFTKFGFLHQFQKEDWLVHGGESFLLWVFVLMFVAAFKKNKKQEAKIAKLLAARKPILAIEGITGRRSVERDFACRITIRNLSNSIKAENVCVRVSGNDDLKIFFHGYNPFHERDLIPATGTNDINPNATKDFLFSKDFNTLVNMIEHRRYARKASEQNEQTFVIELSCANAQSLVETFVIGEGDEPGFVIFEKRKTE